MLKNFSISSHKLVRFTKNLSSLLLAGIPLSKALTLMERQIHSAAFKNVIQDLIEKINNGSPFSNALKEHPKTFPHILISTAQVGENCGSLAEVLSQSALYLEEGLEFRQKIISALIYPAIVLILSICSILFMVLFLLPSLSSVFTDIGMPLPRLTRIVMGFSYISIKYFYLVIFVLMAAVGTVLYLKRKPSGSLYFDKLVLQLPLIGKLYQQIYLQRISQSLTLTLESGVPLVSAMAVANQLSTNRVYKKALDNVLDEIKMGKKMGESLRVQGVFSEILVELVSCGEESGSLSKMFSEAAQYFKKEVEFNLKQITTLAAPVSTIVVSLIVGVIVVSMFLPIVNMMEYLQIQ